MRSTIPSLKRKASRFGPAAGAPRGLPVQAAFGREWRRAGQAACLALVAAFLLAPGFLRAADPPKPTAAATNRYEFRAEHDPDGIGKFYQGREIAQVMGHEGADWLERAERADEEQPDLLMRRLELQPGMVVADIGAGTGYFTRRLARKVGPAGKVMAVDIQPEMLALLTNQMAQLRISNVVTVLGTTTTPRLPEASVDLALMVDVYHEFDFPYEMMQGILASLKPGGRVVFVEYRAEDASVPIKPLHKMTEAQVKKEMAAVPLQWVETSRILPRQHIIVFRKPAGAPSPARPGPGTP